jgi:predicted RNA-binding protein with PUA-like domain
MSVRKKKQPRPHATRGPRRSAAPAPAAPAAPHADGKWAEWFVRKSGERRYWLVKSEPGEFSFDDLLQAPGRTTGWDGVRNFAARNFLKDGMKQGDLVFFYQSSTDPQAIVGICEVVREAYPDATAFDRRHKGYDAGARTEAPTWYQVDLRAVELLAHPVTLAQLKATKALAGMALLRIGRLSVTPVSAAEWKVILGMA